MPIFVYKERRESKHGQGTISYSELNVRPTERFTPQAAPDPIRQGATQARPSKMPVVCMGLGTWDYGFASDFIPYAHHPIMRQMGIPKGRAQQQLGVRPNISRPAAIAYGSLFQLKANSSYNIG